MLELVQRYYATERQIAFLGAATGILLLVVAFLLWRGVAAASPFRGMAYALVMTGLLLGGSGLSYASIAGKRAPAAVAAYATQSDQQIRQQEVTRMEKVLASAYIGGLATFTAMLLIGLVLIFMASPTSPWKGVALALMLTGALGHCLEANSMYLNRQYLQTLQS
jgi:hypothetical protein